MEDSLQEGQGGSHCLGSALAAGLSLLAEISFWVSAGRVALVLDYLKHGLPSFGTVA